MVLDVPNSVTAREVADTVTPPAGGGGSVIVKSAKLSVSLTPPALVSPVLVSIPRPMMTVSAVLSTILSMVAFRVMAAVVAVVPVWGPVNTTLALPLFRLLYCTPAAAAPVSV